MADIFSILQSHILALPQGHGANITDAPRFAWRGLMWDCARRFFTPAQLKRVVDAMAANKMNSLHLHLSDGEAFPVRVAAFPRLAQDGAYDFERASYSTADLKQVVEYAKLRGVRE